MVRPGQAGAASLVAGGSLADWPSSGHVVASTDRWNDPRGPTTGSIMGSWQKGVRSPRTRPLLGPTLRILSLSSPRCPPGELERLGAAGGESTTPPGTAVAPARTSRWTPALQPERLSLCLPGPALAVLPKTRGGNWPHNSHPGAESDPARGASAEPGSPAGRLHLWTWVGRLPHSEHKYSLPHNPILSHCRGQGAHPPPKPCH